MRPFPIPALNKSRVRYIFLFIILFSLPAFLINLSLMTFIEDEAIRSLVALEMWYDKDFISPSLHGTPYFKKPPLYNWILLLSAQLFGYFGEWPARIPTLVFLGLFAYSVYRFYRPKWGYYPALLLTGMLLTSGRILFWESLLGLIDICFSWLVYLIWIALYRFEQKDQYFTLYLSVWVLTAAGFLLKGLPVLVFTGLSLGLWFVLQGKWNKLFHPGHLAGLGLFLLLTGTYYTLFAMVHDPATAFSTLWSESSQRTPLEYGLWESLKHLIEFPIEMFYHFLPWSVLLIFLRKKSFWKEIWSDPFLRFHFVMIAGNIWIYWISPQVYPRYLLMFIPFISALCIAGYFRERADHTTVVKSVFYIFAGIMGIVTAGILSPLFIDRVQDIPFLLPKVILLFLAMGAVTLFYFRHHNIGLLLLVAFMLLLRIGFDWFILPPRNEGDWANQCREQSERIGLKYRDDKLLLWKDVHLYYTNGFYISAARNKPMQREDEQMKEGNYYIVHPDDPVLDSAGVRAVDSFCIRHEKQFMPVVEFYEHQSDH